jgi:hypothetical protein
MIGHEKCATPEYLIERGVVMYDIFNRMVLPANAKKARKWDLERKQSRRPSYKNLHCVELRAEGKILQFGSLLDAAELRERFPKFKVTTSKGGNVEAPRRARRIPK